MNLKFREFKTRSQTHCFHIQTPCYFLLFLLFPLSTLSTFTTCVCQGKQIQLCERTSETELDENFVKFKNSKGIRKCWERKERKENVKERKTRREKIWVKKLNLRFLSSSLSFPLFFSIMIQMGR